MSVSVGNNTVPDAVLSVEGGEAFLTRLRELAAAKQAADEATENLRLGRSAKEAADAAEARLIAANNALDDARRTAAAIVKEAEGKAATIIEDAQKERATLMSGSEVEARQKLKEASDEILKSQAEVNAWATQCKIESNEMVKAARDDRAAASADRAEASRLLVEAQMANESAKKANDAVQALRRDLEARADRARAVLAETGQ